MPTDQVKKNDLWLVFKRTDAALLFENEACIKEALLKIESLDGGMQVVRLACDSALENVELLKPYCADMDFLSAVDFLKHPTFIPSRKATQQTIKDINQHFDRYWLNELNTLDIRAALDCLEAALGASLAKEPHHRMSFAKRALMSLASIDRVAAKTALMNASKLAK